MELSKPPRKGKERDREQPQTTDLDARMTAFLRRTSRPKGAPQQPASSSQPSPAVRTDRSPKLATASRPPQPTSPRKQLHAQSSAPRPDFSRRLRISSAASPPKSSKQAQPHKLFNPDSDPVRTRRTTEPEAMSIETNGSYAPRVRNHSSHAHPRDAGRQLFDHRKDDPTHLKTPPVPKSSMDRMSASSASSYAQSTISSTFTLSSASDSSATSAQIDAPTKPNEESTSNVFALQLKSLETKVKQEDADEAEDSGRILLKGREVENGELEKEKWKKQIADHKHLVDTIHSLLEMSLASNVPSSLRNIPTKYNIIVRLWTYGFHKLLESLRRASLTSPLALEHLQDFIYYAYTFYTGLLEQRVLESFKSGWLEALGDLARYRMAVAAMVTGNTGAGAALTTAAVSEVTPSQDTPSAVGDSSDSLGAAPLVPVDSPSVGVAAARLLDVEPEKERWRCIAKEWYAMGLAIQPGAGKLHHHLGLLCREVEGEELRGVYHFVKSLTVLHPFINSRESVLPIWSAPAQAKRSLPDARMADLFVLLHGMLFTNIELDDFQPSLSRFLERLAIEDVEERQWTMMAIINIGAVMEYGKPTGTVKRATPTGTGGVMRMMAKRPADDEKMDVDDDPSLEAAGKSRHGAQASPPSSEVELDQTLEQPMSFKLALQLTFDMLSFVLKGPFQRTSPLGHESLNPYLSIILTFLATMLKVPQTLALLQRAIPWEDLAQFYRGVPRRIMKDDLLKLSSPECEPAQAGRERWTLLTDGCSVIGALPEDECLRGMEWINRKVYGKNFWKAEDERQAEMEVLDSSEPPRDAIPEERSSMEWRGRWVRIVRAGVGIANVVDGFVWVEGTREWRIEGALAEKVVRWKQEDAIERQEDERRRMGRRWVDDSMDVDEDEDIFDMSEESDFDDSDEVKALKGNPSAALFTGCPGYTVLVVDTNILLSALTMFSSLVESLHWTVVVPLPVIMELDNHSSILRASLPSFSMSLKIQTSRGNYLPSLHFRTEAVDFTGESSDRNMDDLILKAAIWQDEHWMDRSGMLKAPADDTNGAVKVLLVTSDRNLRLKARSRQLPAASERDLIAILGNTNLAEE
ncbi:hypothetical protein BD779DRAFT_1610166 [Infundibulicybe gibba]|nr:hypothetical protein BD779DRAFT_1610166 [Infundibulicybe gibba]